MNRFLIAGALPLLIAGCAHPPSGTLPDRVPDQAQSDGTIASFSAKRAGGPLQRWAPLLIHRNKKPTQYQLVAEQDKTILHARAAAASSGLMQEVDIDPSAQPWLSWRWRIGNLIAGADNYKREAEDSPVRIVLGFDGDKESLPFTDQILFETAKLLTGREIPYATLMYVWENKASVGTVIPNSRTGRIKMMVAGSGADGIGQWHEFTRNIAEDYQKAFGEKPGRLIGVGVLTDTDNTGETVEAWYGDIRSYNEAQVASKSKGK